jgi:hypothetical protein
VASFTEHTGSKKLQSNRRSPPRRYRVSGRSINFLDEAACHLQLTSFELRDPSQDDKNQPH